LLPENPAVLDRWAQLYKVPAANPFKMLSHVGADVPGAAQYVSEEKVADLQSGRAPQIEWLSEAQLAQRLRQLKDDISLIRLPGDIGTMSLPGAQAKTAFFFDAENHRWGVPSGRAATTHIFKPAIPGFRGLVENEHLCQNIAARLGMVAAKSSVMELDDSYIVVERYDRLPPPSGSHIAERIHQEDLCQALGLMPTRKYQEEGGPGVAKIVALLRGVSSDPQDDVDRFLRANMFNWLIGGTDAHAKNYSLLIAENDAVRLAPLYDLSSQLPYPDQVQAKVAMKIGDHYECSRIGLKDWRKLARSCAVDEDAIITPLIEMADALPDAIVEERNAGLMNGLAEDIIVPLSDQMIAHVHDRRASITTRKANLTR
jgi:serine/threonine-protein kinase HipA